MSLSEFVPGQVWLQDYPIHYAGCDFDARMAVVRVSDTELLLHSPCDVDPATKDEISAFKRILDWDFDKIIIAHGDLIETDAKKRAIEAWKKPLSAS